MVLELRLAEGWGVGRDEDQLGLAGSHALESGLITRRKRSQWLESFLRKRSPASRSITHLEAKRDLSTLHDKSKLAVDGVRGGLLGCLWCHCKKRKTKDISVRFAALRNVRLDTSESHRAPLLPSSSPYHLNHFDDPSTASPVRSAQATLCFRMLVRICLGTGPIGTRRIDRPCWLGPRAAEQREGLQRPRSNSVHESTPTPLGRQQ